MVFIENMMKKSSKFFVQNSAKFQIRYRPGKCGSKMVSNIDESNKELK